MSLRAPVDALVCHVNLARGFRGGERQTELLAAELARRGLRQRVVARRGAPLAERCRGIDGVEVIETSSQPLLAARGCRGAGLLHAHEARAIYACWLGSGFGKTPWLLTRRVDNPFKSSLLRDRAYRSAHARCGVSTAIAAQVEAQYPGQECEVVADAHAGMTPLPPPPELAERFAGRTVIGHVGALDHAHKGQGTLLDVARRAANERPAWHFVLVGDGRDEAVFRQQAEGLENVTFAGYVDNVSEWLAVFDRFAFPSLHEGLGSTLLDAMHFGLPIVASRVGGIPDIVEDGVSGLLVPPSAPADIFAALARVDDEPALRESLVEGAKKTAAQFSAAAMADRYLEIYGRLLAGRD